jgi:hypothetical protein
VTIKTVGSNLRPAVNAQRGASRLRRTAPLGFDLHVSASNYGEACVPGRAVGVKTALRRCSTPARNTTHVAEADCREMAEGTGLMLSARPGGDSRS